MTADETTKTTLLKALCAFQAEAPVLPKDKTNPHFKSRFTSLDAIVEKIQPLLAKHGLAWVSMPTRDEDGKPALRYQLWHAPSNAKLEGVMPLFLTKQDPQGFGSAITYARRYAITAVLNLVADEDDDGNTASQQVAVKRKPAVLQTQPITTEEAETLINAAAMAGIRDKLQLAASHAHGDDVGDCSTDAKAKVALRALAVPEAEKVADWIQKKAAEAKKTSEAKDAA